MNDCCNRSCIKATIIGGIVLFLWGMISWMALPWHQPTLKAFGNETEVVEVLTRNVTEAGVYMAPNNFEACTPGTPFVFASVLPNGFSRGMGAMMGFGIAIQLIAALLAAFLLSKASGLDFKQKVGFYGVIGILTGLLGYATAWNWWGFSLGYTIVGIVDSVIGWVLAGIAVAFVTKK